MAEKTSLPPNEWEPPPHLYRLFDLSLRPQRPPGASSALVASPCCTPVLASILGFIATSQDPALGLVLLLTYSIGYTTPLMAAGTASGVLSRLMSANGLKWITPASGALLISYGTYNGLSALFGAA